MRPFRGDVERSELRAVYMMVYTRPRGAASFAHMGSLQEAWLQPAAAAAEGTVDGAACLCSISVIPVNNAFDMHLSKFANSISKPKYRVSPKFFTFNLFSDHI